MSGHRSFEVLRSRMSSERKEANIAAAQEMNRLYVLSQIRREIGLTQVEVADRLAVAQPTYAAFERSDNLRVGTLSKIVSALGGVLKFHVEIDGRDYPLGFPEQHMALA